MIRSIEENEKNNAVRVTKTRKKGASTASFDVWVQCKIEQYVLIDIPILNQSPIPDLSVCVCVCVAF